MGRLVIFLDNGGVMSNHIVRRAQWLPLVAEFFVPRLGGTPDAWSAANRQVITRIADPNAWQTRLRTSPNYRSYDRQYHLDWLRWMCDLVGVPAPGDDDDCLALAHAAYSHIPPRTQAAYPGVVDAIQKLHGQGYLLHTASGESSLELDGYLRGMGVRGYFEKLYGPDLIDTFKDGPRFYERLFADAGVAPQDALVVDDSNSAVNWATQVGARTALVSDPNITMPHVLSITNPTLCINNLAELPAAVDRLS